MEAIPKNYKWYRRKHQLFCLRPQEAVRWIMGTFLSSLAKRREEFPTTVSIEVTNDCNMGCSTCPQPLILGEKGYLNIDLFKKIIDECCQFPSLTNIVFTGFGEPFLNPQLISMSRYAKSKKTPFVRSYTNCVLLNKQMTDEILVKPGFDEMTLSLNAPTQEIYERIRKNRYYKLVTENIEYFLLRRIVLKTKTPFVNLQLLRLKDVPLNPEAFIHKWLPLLKLGDCISMKDSHSFAGQVNDPGVGTMGTSARRLPCGQLWNYLFISWNGDVSPCSSDPFKKLKIGNVGNTSLKDLWHSSEIQHMRAVHLQREYHQIPLCSQCETWRYFCQGANRPIPIIGRL